MNINVEDNYAELCELVRDVASDCASNAINSGEMLQFLLSNGYTEEEIIDWLEECHLA